MYHHVSQKFPENITPENEEFLQEVVQKSFSSPLALEPWARGEWAPKSQRCGLVGKKIGYYPMWKRDGTKMMATVLHVCIGLTKFHFAVH